MARHAGRSFAAVFARPPQLWETPFFLTGWLPIAGVMFYGGIAACRSAPRAGADDTRPPAPPVARFLHLQLMGLVVGGLTGAAILIVAIGGSLALLALSASMLRRLNHDFGQPTTY